MTDASVDVHYGQDVQAIRVPARSLLDVAGMRVVAAAEDPLAVIEAALESPTGSLPLEQAVSGAARVVILVDDLTRPTPVHLLLPPVLQRLARGGVASDNILIMVATGTHRPMTAAELDTRLGADVCARYHVRNHDYRIPEDMVDMGATPSGVPISVNRAVAEADFVIGIGNITPHRYCGWSGGAKIIQPGVGGEPTTAGTHLMITKDPNARLGVVENRVRHEMEVVAERANLRFIVNTVLDRVGSIVDVAAGDFRLAFRRGVELARHVYSAQLTGLADIVLASAYPADFNLWQAGKALYAADLAVRQGGIIILASPCYEGIGEHEEFANLLGYDYAAIDRLIAQGGTKNRIGAAGSLAVALVAARAAIWCVTDTIPDERARQMNMIPQPSVQHAVDAALAARGPDARLTILREAAEVLPILPAGE